MVASKIKVAFLVTVLWSAQLLAWGSLGHQTVAAIALNHLDSRTRSAVQQLLGSDDFVASAVWADTIKRQSEWHHTSPYHFANIPEGSDYINSLTQFAADARSGDVVQGLLKAESTLRNSSASSQDKAYALKFLIHFVGDLHQPLHTGRPVDLGGNKIEFRWQNRKINLHSLWDTYMIEDTYKDQLKGKTPAEQAQWYAGKLEQSFNVTDRGVDVLTWISQTTQYQSVAYDTDYQNNQSSYQQKALPVIEQQLTLAGYRLANYLNAIFDGEKISQENLNAIQQIQQYVPNFMTNLDLTPKMGALYDINTPNAKRNTQGNNGTFLMSHVWMYKELSTLGEMPDEDND